MDGSEEEQCPVCWGLLCEPVAWPACGHHFCLVCTLATRRSPTPSCPLCRSSGSRVCTVSALQVDTECAARVRQAIGFSAYEARRRKIWADAAKPPEELRAMPLLCTKIKAKTLKANMRLGLRLSEPRCQEMVRRAMAPGGNRRFATVTRNLEGEIDVGAIGRLCRVIESSEAEDGVMCAIAETGMRCRVLGVSTESSCQSSPSLILGELEELEEAEEEEDDAEQERVPDEDRIEDGAEILLDADRLEDLRERQLLLEVLHATMELERARLEQRRLELTVLLAQRRIYQEIVDLNSQVTELVGFTTATSGSSTVSSRALRSRSTPQGMGALLNMSAREGRDTRIRDQSSPSPVALSTRIRQAAQSSQSLFRSYDPRSSSMSETQGRSRPSNNSSTATEENSRNPSAVATRSVRSSSGAVRAGAVDQTQQQSRRGQSSSSASAAQRGSTQAEAIRRRGGDMMSLVRGSDSTTDARSVLLNAVASTSQAQRRQPREGREGRGRGS